MIYFMKFLLLNFLSVSSEAKVFPNELSSHFASKAFTSERIVGGTVATEKLDFMTFIQMNSQNRRTSCGGSLIGPNLVVTAAHCVQGITALTRIESAVIRITGSLESRTGVSYRALKVVTHEQYNKKKLTADIALIFVEMTQNYLGRVPVPIILATTDQVFPNLTAAGFGLRAVGGAISSNLRTVDLNDFPISTCLTAYRRNRKNLTSEANICAGNETGGKDTCNGDSGGPLYGKSLDGSPILYGLTSWGDSACNSVRGRNMPGVYTRLSFYADWIEQKIQEYNGLTSTFSKPLGKAPSDTNRTRAPLEATVFPNGDIGTALPIKATSLPNIVVGTKTRPIQMTASKTNSLLRPQKPVVDRVPITSTSVNQNIEIQTDLMAILKAIEGLLGLRTEKKSGTPSSLAMPIQSEAPCLTKNV